MGLCWEMICVSHKRCFVFGARGSDEDFVQREGIDM
jgi:hypothetical protein